MAEKITINELISIISEGLDDGADGEQTIERLFKLITQSDMEESPEPPGMLDMGQSLPPKIRINTDEIAIPPGGEIDNNLTERFHEALKTWRQKRYDRKVQLFERTQWDLVKIVSEGDSWFQYPLVRNDIIDQIFEPRKNFIFNRDNPYAVFSLGNAGARLEEMVREAEYIQALRDVKPSWFMLSGGGNDLLDEGQGFEDLIVKFSDADSQREIEDEEIKDYIIQDNLDNRLKFVMDLYQEIFERVTQEAEFNSIKILCHGYDYVIPTQSGLILGAPMKARNNIDNENTMFKVIKYIIDRFNDELIRLVKAQPNFEGRFFYVDCRNAASKSDFNTNPIDDFHPSSEGFKKIADRFLAVLNN
ncbi:SGNH/GDSL hydrolase family protein [Leptolyngbya cf. ectocarpi LEGE 11479]|uniref:SGNH/GDSL hydrolase family protein n=1 Tax=Leptolyngbya cf. ectocarpi LEGE 11479 TaxID=1828722 RepID=A0A928X4H8_LEPEC|nr:SGNH/GDSL hydrolase family protein [Leptolyngbya ectocarpi]MBE9066428.1 SGNH/GDSL hydrolase family protein [Leptolyngbya cf. ectocarpi LEGE 11479]